MLFPPLSALAFSLALALFPPPAAAADPVNPAVAATKAAVQSKVAQDAGYLLDLYKHLHTHPELSLQEVQTADRMARELRGLGFAVTEKVGGTGVVGVLKNGRGPTVMVRTDMDGLPVVERTGLAYASKVRIRDKAGNEVGVMHACGHDMHMTCWVGAARVLSGMKERWQGTLVFIAQPAEEIGAGARMMLEDGLYKRFPRPDYCLALHCDARTAHGQLSFTEGMALANVDTVDILVKGKGGHGASPHTTIDPVVVAARIILDLQTIVSREVNPTDPAVVTVGSIHGGTKHNIIPNEVKLQLTVRTTKDSVRAHVLGAITRIAKGAAATARAPEPEVTHHAMQFTPALYNDSGLTRKTVAALKELLGEKNLNERPPVLGGEDFSRYAKDGDRRIPVFMFWLGTMPPEQIQESEKEGGRPLPSLHADVYHPIPKPSIKVGVAALSTSVLNLVGK